MIFPALASLRENQSVSQAGKREGHKQRFSHRAQRLQAKPEKMCPVEWVQGYRSLIVAMVAAT
jgi:hypothetical protein